MRQAIWGAVVALALMPQGAAVAKGGAQNVETAQPDRAISAQSESVLDAEVWGVLAELVGTSWSAIDPRYSGATNLPVHEFSLTDNGRAIEYFARRVTGVEVHIVFRPGSAPGVLDADVATTLVWDVQLASRCKRATFRLVGRTMLASGWCRRSGTFLTGKPKYVAYRFELNDGALDIDAMDADSDRSPPDFDLLYDYAKLRRHSPEELAVLWPRLGQLKARADARAEAEAAAEARARSEERQQLFGAVLQGVSQGMADVAQEQQEAAYQQALHEAELERIRRQYAPAEQYATPVGDAGNGVGAGTSTSTITSTGRSTAATGGAQPGNAQQGNAPTSPENSVGASTMPAAVIPSTPKPAKQCELVTKTYSRRSLPKPSIAEAESYIAGFPSDCGFGAQPTRGSLECSEKSEPVVTRDEKGIPRITGRKTLYTCEVAMTCPPAEVCEGNPGTGASAQ